MNILGREGDKDQRRPTRICGDRLLRVSPLNGPPGANIESSENLRERELIEGR